MEQTYSLKSRRLNEFDLLEFLALFLMITAQTNGMVMKSFPSSSPMQADLIALNHYLGDVPGTLLFAFCIGSIIAINTNPSPGYYIKKSLILYGVGVVVNTFEAILLHLYYPTKSPTGKDLFITLFTNRLFIYLSLILIFFAIIIKSKKTYLVCGICFIVALLSGNSFLQELSIPMAGFLFGNELKKAEQTKAFYIKSTFLSIAFLVGIPVIQMTFGNTSHGILKTLWVIALFMTLASILQPFVIYLKKYKLTFIPFSSDSMIYLYLIQKLMVFLSIPLLLQIPGIYSCCLISFVLYCISLIITHMIFQARWDRKTAKHTLSNI